MASPLGRLLQRYQRSIAERPVRTYAVQAGKV